MYIFLYMSDAAHPELYSVMIRPASVPHNFISSGVAWTRPLLAALAYRCILSKWQ